MKNEIFFSIVMPAYNSERTIGKALQSVRKQKFDQSRIEILVIDGGSDDSTTDIARRYGAEIIFNKDRVPEAAKRLGYQRAKGRWIIKQDSDEVFISDMQLADRKKFIDSNPDVHCILTDRLLPGKGCGISCAYLNHCGDPFSYIVYQIKGSVIKENQKYLYRQTDCGYVYQYKKGDRYPIGDGGCTAFDICKFRELFGERYDTQEFVNLSTQKLLEKTSYMGCIPGDNIYHYSNAGLITYLKKLRFKIHFNLNGGNMLGYTAKAQNDRKYSRRKWLFVLYALSLVLPFADSVKLVFDQKDISFLMHFVYTYYVLFITFAEVLKKVFKKDNGRYSYG